MAKIAIKPNESMKDALKRFKKMCNNEGIISQLRRSAYYEKPSEKRRRAESTRLKNIRKFERLRQGKPLKTRLKRPRRFGPPRREAPRTEN
ncbi:MAG: 30S ribosomal protein S21 [Planctomycetes bacterium]|nr:30S ribosomal protein S21 [Planctomycetota bacterium]